MSSKAETTTQATSKKTEIDMSERAINARLEEVQALYELGISLMSIDVSKGVPVEPKRR